MVTYLHGLPIKVILPTKHHNTNN